MRIATWNVERLKHNNMLDEIISQCDSIMADILVLTETDQRVMPNYANCIKTDKIVHCDTLKYGEFENRVSIFTNYKCVRTHKTFDNSTAVCAELETEQGNILVYGTIIGIYGNRHSSFKEDLKKQIEDFKNLSRLEIPLCICGDYNISFCDNYYYTKWGREIILDTFASCGIEILTRNMESCIDHIAITKGFIKKMKPDISEWNLSKTLSDHKGIVVSV